MTASGYTFTEHNPADYTDEEIAIATEFGNAVSAEVLPDDPPTPVDLAIAANRTRPARLRRTTFHATAPDGSLVGSVNATIDPEYDDNPDVLGCGITIAKDHRRRGIATALLAQFIGLARSEGRTRLIGTTYAPLPAGAAFAEAIGGTSKAAVHMNHLPIAEVDRALMEQWVSEGPVRAEGYELVGWDGRVPDEYLEAHLDLVLVMNDAPRDDLQLNDFTLTAEEIREQEVQMEAVGYEPWTLVARRVSDGAFAGFHDVVWGPHEPDFVYVGATGVRNEHRGHALGKWLKAAMTLRILDERPNATDIRTGNADSNDAMLGINRLMGYRPLIGTTTWEVGVEDAAQWLKSKGVDIPDRPPVVPAS